MRNYYQARLNGHKVRERFAVLGFASSLDFIGAKAGERDPERLCEGALKATQPVIPVLISDPSPLPPHASPPVLPDS